MLLAARGAGGAGSAVGFIYDDQIWAVEKEGVAAAVELGVVYADDDVWVVLEDTEVLTRQVTL